MRGEPKPAPPVFSGLGPKIGASPERVTIRALQATVKKQERDRVAVTADLIEALEAWEATARTDDEHARIEEIRKRWK